MSKQPQYQHYAQQSQASWFKRFLQRFQLTPVSMVLAELKDAELAHLQAVSMAEYADFRMQTYVLIAKYHDDRADRLRAYLQNRYDNDSGAAVTMTGGKSVSIAELIESDLMKSMFR